MAIVYWDDFEWATTATLGYRKAESLGTPSITTGISGLTSQVLAISSQSAAHYIGFSLPSAYTEGLFSVACVFTGTPTQRSLITLCSSAVENIVIRLDTDSSITALRNTTALGSSVAGVIPFGRRFRIEIGFTISDTVGTVTVKIDQGAGPVTVLALTNVDTRDASDTTGVVNRFRLYNNYGATPYWDDIWFDTDKTAFRSDMTFKTLVPTADVSGWSTATPLGDRFATIDELPVSTTDYLTYSVVGSDVFTLSNLTTIPSQIAGLGVIYIANKPDSGAVEFRSRIEHLGAYGDGATTGLNMSILGYSDFWATKPGGGAWGYDNVNTAQLVLERIS